MSESNDEKNELTLSKHLLYTLKEAALLLDIPLRSVNHLISCQAFRTTKVGKRQLIHRKELQRYMDSIHPELPSQEAPAAEPRQSGDDPSATERQRYSLRAGGATSAEATVAMESEFLSLTQLGKRWHCPPDTARKLLAAEIFAV